MSTYPFISIKKGMTFYQSETKMGCFFYNARIELAASKCLEWCIECGIKQAFVTDSVNTSLSVNQLVLKSNHLFFAEYFHLASSL